MRLVLASLCLVALSACSSPEPPNATPADPPASVPSGGERNEKESPGPECRSDCAPDFTVTSFEGERFVLADHFGKVVVINFFESW